MLDGVAQGIFRAAHCAVGLSADVVEPAFAVNDVVDAECQQVEPFGLHAVYERNDAVGFERVVGVDHHRVSAA